VAHTLEERDYALLKEELAKRFPTDREAYQAGKDVFKSSVA